MSKQLLKQWALGLTCGLALAGCASQYQTSSLAPYNKATHAAADNINLSAAYLREGKVEIAKQKILQAQREAPNWPPVLDGLAMYYAAIGNNERADSYYREAIRLASHDGNLQNNYGTFLCSTGKYKQSISRFLNAIEDPDYISTAAAYENAGLCAQKIPNTHLAMTYYEKALKIEPLRPTSLYELANLEFKAGKVADANKLLGRYKAVGQQTADSLWLDIRIARKLHHLNYAASQALVLKSKYPHSKAAKALNKSELS